MAESQYFANPELISAGAFIGPRDKSFYIPAYQRQFSWDKVMIDRLFEDIIDDIEHRMISEEGKTDIDTVSFIGSILCYDNTDFKEIYPQVRNQVPQGVLSVIDGQQRLTVLITSFIILHDYIRVDKSKLPEGWLKDKCIETMAELSEMFQTIRPTGKVRVYPKMIRAFDDQWSTYEKDLDDKSPKYASPLSHYSFCYGDFLQDAGNEKVKFKYDRGSGIKDETLKENHDKFNKAHRLIKKHIIEICENPPESFPKIENLIKNEDILHALLNISDLSGISIEEDNDYDLQCRLMRAILLSAYIMKRIYFVSLVTQDESYAFDIFDSLNTTGELLTAYETFRPSVIRKEGIGGFQKSVSKGYMDVIEEEYLNLLDVSQKQKETADLLITFALAEDGTTLSKKLQRQRKYLIKTYKERKEGEGKEFFIRHLMHVSEVKRLWKNKDYATIVNDLDIPGGLISQEISQEIKEAHFCLRFLETAKHTISLALITRFYESVKIATENERIERVKDLCGAIKAIAAFFAIWRSSRESTEGIDNLHRDIMKNGINGEFIKFNRMGGTPNLKDLQKSFCYLLKEHGGSKSKKTINSVDAWVKNSQDIPIYRTATTVAKFVLMTAYHNTHPDHQKPGFITKVRNRVKEALISAEKWDSDEYGTVEHIIPQQESKENKEVSNDSLDRIGNLTIVPRVPNSILAARTWDEKMAIYRFLSSESEGELEEAAKGLPSDLSRDAIEKLIKTGYLHMTKAISLKGSFSYIDKPEDPSDIAKRGENILRNSWDVLSEWLDFNPD